MRDLLAHAATIAKFQLGEWVNIKDYDKDGLTYVHVQSPCSQQALVYVNVFCLYKGFGALQKLSPPSLRFSYVSL